MIPHPARATRPLTRAQCLENRAFLKALAKTGNIREAAHATGLKHGTMFHRRTHHPAFATEWDAAVAVADAVLQEKIGRKGPEAVTSNKSPHRTRYR